MPTNKYAEGYPGRRYYGGCEVVDEIEQHGDRPREGAVRRRARERPAARGRADEHGRLHGGAAARRHDPLARALARRPPHARAEGQLLRPALHDRPLRRLARDEPRRLRRGARARQAAQAEADRLRRLRLPAHGRDRPLPRDRGRGRRAAALRHGALRGPRRGRAAPEPGQGLPLRHLDHAQDARRPARRVHPLHRGARAGGRPRRLPGDAGRPARAHDRGQGDLLPDRRDRRLPRVPDPGARQRRHARDDAPGGRARRAHRRHRHAPAAGRPALDRVDRQGRRGAAGRGEADGQPQHRALRRAAADGRLGDPDRHAGGDDARLRRGRLPRGRLDHLRRARRRRRRGRARRRGARRCARSGRSTRASAATPRTSRDRDAPGRDRRRRTRSSSTSSRTCATRTRPRSTSASSRTS